MFCILYFLYILQQYLYPYDNHISNDIYNDNECELGQEEEALSFTFCSHMHIVISISTYTNPCGNGSELENIVSICRRLETQESTTPSSTQGRPPWNSQLSSLSLTFAGRPGCPVILVHLNNDERQSDA